MCYFVPFQISDLSLKGDYQDKEDKWLSEAFEKGEEVRVEEEGRPTWNFLEQNVFFHVAGVREVLVSCANSTDFQLIEAALENTTHNIALVSIILSLLLLLLTLFTLRTFGQIVVRK